MHQKLVIGLVLAMVLLISGIFFWNMNTQNKDEDNTSPSSAATITSEELEQGWYWGEVKRPGTPDTWILVLQGTRSVRWIDPNIVTQ
jgi:nitrogen fixation-related uncharacterized protein